ncbi:MAG: Gfo/Idh/MocA family oxidoreductase [Saprospiraceae bacterium]|nr:Gfo/Idh/MocA family oxidoreductase [Saprospiraceae bacterium]MBK6814898.1 Gfo/Idh/MocA family oxidoreductase [Saprospiraceae bacterium]MBK7606251.1 Gfo/Idh/MocA family oxidoreductase [Saprospiraceae bacterium]MBK8511199.1 Gfo/Idh/MocA family oxidoreductase [Saprospiraceae bacterium]MBK9677978.1 Gfo/Idh/MocA family oxidoreductase [Saprospiraceae bacterium]
MNRKLRMGMVGGGRGAFIGGVHRIAANMDGLIELVAGAFSSDPAKSKASGSDLMLAPDRCYGSYEEMILSEKQLPEDKRIDIISIVTPNHMHYEPAKLALESGFDVICDKPLSFTMSEALDLQKTVTETGRIFALTHNYTGYPMVKQARCMIRDGKLGTIRKLVVEYPQGWLTDKIEGSDHSSGKQATWRTDPLRSGIAGSMGDIGTHAENLAEYITGLQIEEMCADISVMVPGRLLDDDGNVLLHMNNGARGILFASQISAGEENNLKIRVYGEYGGLEWSQHEPNTLILKWHDRPTEIYRTGVGDLYPEANAHRRIPAGHPEGYLEAFANIYRNFALAVIAKKEGRSQDPLYDFPTVADGVRGMQFIESVIASGKSDTKWVKF